MPQMRLHSETEGDLMIDPLCKFIDKMILELNLNPNDACNAIYNYQYVQHDNEGTYYYQHFITGRFLLIDSNDLSVVVGDFDFTDYGNKPVLH